MKSMHAALAAGFIAVLSMPAIAAEKPLATIPVKVGANADVYPTQVETDGGITVQTMDGRATFVLDGRLQFDNLFYTGIYNDSHAGGYASDTKTRRMRLGVGGHLDQEWEWQFTLDVNNDTGKATLDTGQITYKGFSYADVNVGRFKRPFLLDTLTSSKWLSVVERSLAYDVVRSHVSDFSVMGSKLYDVGTAGKLSWYAAVLNEGVEDYAGGETPAGKDQYQYYGRVAYAPWAKKGDVLHFGLAAGELNPAAGSTIAIGTRLGVSSADLHSILYTVDDDQQLGGEVAYELGPFSAQGEYVLRRLNLTAGDSADVTAGYLQLTYTLTGEPRVYKPYWARFDRVLPSGEHAFGAVELVARYDDLRMDNPGAAAATGRVGTLGVNWYLNSHLHLMLDYLNSKGENFGTTETTGDAVTTRIAFQF